MPTLITTPAAADANSYASLVEANAYASGHFYASGWFTAAEAKQEAALIMTCRILDAMPRAWTGAASTAEQALGFPRIGMLNKNGFAIASGEIPVALKNAHSEFARQIVENAVDPTETSDIVAQGITSVKVGPVAVTFKEGTEEFAALARRWALEMQIPDAVIALLVPSWLIDPRVEDAEFNGFLVENL